jgi:hypothetical protein
VIGLYGAYKLGKYHAKKKVRVRQESPEEQLFWLTCLAIIFFWPIALFVWLKNKILAHIIHISLWTFIIFNGIELYLFVGLLATILFIAIQVWRYTND